MNDAPMIGTGWAAAALLDTFIHIDGKELGLSHDVLIFSGRTEAEMAADMMEKAAMAPDAKISVSKRSKN